MAYRRSKLAFTAFFVCALSLSVSLETWRLNRAEAKSSAKNGENHFKADKNEWMLSQKDRIVGKHRVFITQDAIRIECLTNRFVYCAHAPDWLLYGFRDDDKVYTVGDLASYGKDYDPIIVPAKNFRLTKLGTQTKDGFVVSNYRGKLQDNTPLFYSILEIPNIAPEVGRILFGYYRVGSPLLGLPYQVARGATNDGPPPDLKSWNNSYLTDTNTPAIFVGTSAIVKVPYHASDFECPKGYKACKGSEIFLSKTMKNHYTDALMDMGLGTEFGHKK